MNRHHRRVLTAAVRYLRRATKVPGKVRVQLDPKALDAMAARMGRKIGVHGVVTKVPA